MTALLDLRNRLHEHLAAQIRLGKGIIPYVRVEVLRGYGPSQVLLLEISSPLLGVLVVVTHEDRAGKVVDVLRRQNISLCQVLELLVRDTVSDFLHGVVTQSLVLARLLTVVSLADVHLEYRVVNHHLALPLVNFSLLALLLFPNDVVSARTHFELVRHEVPEAN